MRAQLNPSKMWFLVWQLCNFSVLAICSNGCPCDLDELVWWNLGLWKLQLPASLQYPPCLPHSFLSNGQPYECQDVAIVTWPVAQIQKKNLILPCLVCSKSSWLVKGGLLWAVFKNGHLLREEKLSGIPSLEFKSSHKPARSNIHCNNHIASCIIDFSLKNVHNAFLARALAGYPTIGLTKIQFIHSAVENMVAEYAILLRVLSFFAGNHRHLELVKVPHLHARN